MKVVKVIPHRLKRQPRFQPQCIKLKIQCNPRDFALNNEAQVCFIFLDTLIMVNFMSRARVRIQATVLRHGTYMSHIMRSE